MTTPCPTCERRGGVCDYCKTLCGEAERMVCVCGCHVADRAREAEIAAEKLARIQL